MTGERLAKCKEHNTTGADSCPDCNQELGKGVFEERILRVKVKAEVSYLKGIEISDGGKEVNTNSDTELGWDDIVNDIQRGINLKFLNERYNKEIEISCEEWE